MPVLKSLLHAVRILLALVAMGSGAVFAQDDPDAPELPSVKDVRVSTTPERARLVIDLTDQTEFALVALDKPDRLAIDVKAEKIDAKGTGKASGVGIIKSYVVEQAAPDRVRTALELSGPAQVQQAYVLAPFEDQPARLVVDIITATPEDFAAKVATDLANSNTINGPSVAQAPTPPGGSNLPVATKPLVVIDPGHGGIDSGAETPAGIKEKDIVLKFCLKLQDLLVSSGRFDVALTREGDNYLKLEDRVALARQNKADLFISIHADTFAQKEIRGASVYTRDENATDVLDKILAENENKVDVIGGFAMPQMPPQVVDILVDLMRRETRIQSYTAAEDIVHQLEPSVTLRRFPVRQADFFVLQAPDVPSILIELGFLSNADDMANLQQEDWRDRTADAVARGISAYFDTLAPKP